MPLTQTGVLPGAPTKYIYEDYETGEKKVSNRPLNEDGTPVGSPTSNPEAADNGSNAALGADQQEAVDPVSGGNTDTTIVSDESQADVQTSRIYGTNSLDSRAYEVKDPDKTIPGVNSIRSKTNAWALLNYRNYRGGTMYGDPDYSQWGTAVVGTGSSAGEILNPTAHRIVTHCEENGGVGFSYGYRDFIQTEHYGQISNEYLITLRRFSFPVGDDIVNARSYGENGEHLDISEPDLARAITWLSPKLGNDIKEILGFSTGFGWEEIESSVQTASGGSNEKRRGTIGQLIDGSPVTKAVEAGANGYSAAQSDQINTKGEGFDGLSATYPNHVYGPYNAIKKVLARNDKGLKFDSEFNLNFYYDLRGFDNTSPKVVFMDVISNLLAMTYNNAPFWGGATRYSGSGSTGKPFGDMDKLKSGDYSGFLGSVVTQLKSTLGAGFDDLGKAASGLMNGKGLNAIGDSKILDNMVGGALMKHLGSPSGGDIIKAFLTGDPTGQWHLTVGNPMNPILVCGNLCLETSKFEFEGPLGYEGFPTKLKMTVALKPGRPRDKSEIESMFNAGRGRMYLQPEVEGKSLDDVMDMSAYGNKDRSRLTPDRALRNSDMSAG
ncbi:MAG: hypothetical protein ACKVJK_17335 [Methylophagaceae bacterium]